MTNRHPIDYPYNISENQIAISCKDGSTFFVNIGPAGGVDVLFQPDSNHYPKLVCSGTAVNGPFDPAPSY